MPRYCLNSRLWLDFVFTPPDTCPHMENYFAECNSNHCGYYQEREASRWYKYKMKILKSFDCEADREE